MAKKDACLFIFPKGLSSWAIYFYPTRKQQESRSVSEANALLYHDSENANTVVLYFKKKIDYFKTTIFQSC